MELYFLALLVLLMVVALTMGFPVAFSLPGSAILSVAIASLCGYLFAGDVGAYFSQDGPVEWLTAGVTNQRSLYWNVERDTLIAIPLFIFMGIMLQRSKIAEDLLVAMAQLFGPVPGGLGISVVFVGALLAATTGIVGATVIAMGLISLPAMMRNNYSKPLATGTICASGTLGQIIPPSIVLIILADQLSSAASQANNARKELYKASTGEFSMPSQFDVVSASAGDMFMGALVPGIILVGIYMIYILVIALIKPSLAPAVPYDGKYDGKFFINVMISLVPPLALIFIVLGSILLGVATVNQAGAIGAVGAIIMAGYRLYPESKLRYVPAVLALLSVAFVFWLKSQADLNIKNITSDAQSDAIKIAFIAAAVLVFAVLWSTWRTYRIQNTLYEVMVETAKTSSMVFIILLGAAMLTTAFRAFGGEELVQHFLTGLPGGFWTQFIVVMLVIFFLGFFLDFIEIAVVVVPIVAPILLMNPEANVTAVWLGVMIGLNIQTSFLTPPFGFALFYLRGVADKAIKTLDIYKGATVFIVLQLIGLGVAGAYPSLVNYLPSRTSLLAETSPPPINPKLQLCLEEYIDDQYRENGDNIDSAIDRLSNISLVALPEAQQQTVEESAELAREAVDQFAVVTQAKAELQTFADGYKPLHQEVRSNQREQKRLADEINEIDREINRLRYTEGDQTALIESHREHIAELEQDIADLEASIPDAWDAENQTYKSYEQAVTRALRDYHRAADTSANDIKTLIETIEAREILVDFESKLAEIRDTLAQSESEADFAALEALIQSYEEILFDVPNAYDIQSPLTSVRRSLSRDQSAEAIAEAQLELDASESALQAEIDWRQAAAENVLADLQAYREATADSIGIRSTDRLTVEQAKTVALCQAKHRDISLGF